MSAQLHLGDCFDELKTAPSYPYLLAKIGPIADGRFVGSPAFAAIALPKNGKRYGSFIAQPALQLAAQSITSVFVSIRFAAASIVAACQTRCGVSPSTWCDRVFPKAFITS